VVVGCGSNTPPPKPVEDPAPACVAVADHMLVLVDPDPTKPNTHARKIRDIFMLRCEQDAWLPDARACVMETTSLKDPKGCKSKLTVSQHEALDRDLDEVETAARESKLSSCDKYKRRIDQLATCDKLPQASRDALRLGFEAMAQGWAMHEAPEEARNQMNELCKQAVDALEEAVADMCGWK
jgi:hypothetical protein